MSFIFLIGFPSGPSGRFLGLPDPAFLVEVDADAGPAAEPSPASWLLAAEAAATFGTTGGEVRTLNRKSLTSSMMHLNEFTIVFYRSVGQSRN